jgi:hypothetical protein
MDFSSDRQPQWIGTLASSVAVLSAACFVLSVAFQAAYFSALGYPLIITHFTISDYFEASIPTVIILMVPAALMHFAPNRAFRWLLNQKWEQRARKWVSIGMTLVSYGGCLFTAYVHQTTLATVFGVLGTVGLVMSGILVPHMATVKRKIHEEMEPRAKLQQLDQIGMELDVALFVLVMLVDVLCGVAAGLYRENCRYTITVLQKEAPASKQIDGKLVARLGREILISTDAPDVISIPWENVARYSFSPGCAIKSSTAPTPAK